MKILKKTFLIIFVAFTCFGIGAVIFFQIRKSNANKQLIAQNSTSVVKIAVDDVLLDILANHIRNNSFFEEDSLDNKNDVSKWKFGMDIPSSMYFFSFANDLTKLYTYQSLNDEKLFLTRITEALNLSSTDIHKEGDHWWLKSSNGRVKFLGDSRNVLISISYTSIDDLENMNKMWQDRIAMFKEVGSLDSLKNLDLKGDLVYFNLKTKDKVTLDFDAGHIKANAYVKGLTLKPAQNKKVRQMDDQAIFSAYCNLDINSILTILKPYMDKSPSADEFISKSFSGYADLQWKKGEVTQSDTIINYEYDDNYETIEVESVQKIDVPNLTFTIKGSLDLYNKIPNKIFYKVSKRNEKGYLVMRTDIDDTAMIELIDSDYFINLQYKYDKSIDSYIEKISKFEEIKEIKEIYLTGKTAKVGGAIVELDIRLKDSSKHPLLNLF